MLYTLIVLVVTVFYRYDDQIVHPKLVNFTVFKLHLSEAVFFFFKCMCVCVLVGGGRLDCRTSNILSIHKVSQGAQIFKTLPDLLPYRKT